MSPIQAPPECSSQFPPAVSEAGTPAPSTLAVSCSLATLLPALAQLQPPVPPCPVCRPFPPTLNHRLPSSGPDSPFLHRSSRDRQAGPKELIGSPGEPLPRTPPSLVEVERGGALILEKGPRPWHSRSMWRWGLARQGEGHCANLPHGPHSAGHAMGHRWKRCVEQKLHSRLSLPLRTS